MKQTWLGALLLALAACAPQGGDLAPAGERLASRVGPGVVATPPVYALLGYREQLGLSTAQVVALDSIGDWLDRRNAPLLARLREQRGRGGRGGRRPRGEAATEIFRQIGEHNGAAVDGVAALLTAEQRTRVCELFAEDARDRARRPGDSRRPTLARRPRRAERDTLPGAARSRWVWCRRPAVANGR